MAKAWKWLADKVSGEAAIEFLKWLGKKAIGFAVVFAAASGGVLTWLEYQLGPKSLSPHVLRCPGLAHRRPPV